MNAEFMRALDALQTEKNIDKEELVDAIESSIASAYKKNYGNYQDVDVRIVKAVRLRYMSTYRL